MCMLRLLVLNVLIGLGRSQPAVLLQACQNVLQSSNGLYFQSLSPEVQFMLDMQAKRVLGMASDAPSVLTNMSVVRALPDEQLTELVLYGIIGNFTSGAGSSWQQPCRIVFDATTGLFGVQDKRDSTGIILSILVFVLSLNPLRLILQDAVKK